VGVQARGLLGAHRFSYLDDLQSEGMIDICEIAFDVTPHEGVEKIRMLAITFVRWERFTVNELSKSRH